MQTIIQVLQQRWAELSRRERRVVTGGLVVASVTLGFVLVVEPLLGHVQELDRKIERLDRTLVQLASLGAEQADLSEKLARVDAKLAGACHLLGQIEAIKQGQEAAIAIEH